MVEPEPASAHGMEFSTCSDMEFQGMVSLTPAVGDEDEGQQVPVRGEMNLNELYYGSDVV
jgi:hypothetical protein